MKRFKGPKEQLDAARSSEMSADELDILAESQYEFVQTAVAEHTNTKAGTLAGLVPASVGGDGAQALAAALARNSNTPDYALARLGVLITPFLQHERGQWMYTEIAAALACNAATPLDALSKMLSEETCATAIRKKVARESKRPEVLGLLAEDRSEAVRKRALLTLSELEIIEGNE